MQQAELHTKFTEQAQLVQEASEALKAVEAESTTRQQELATELTTLQNQWKLTYSRPLEKPWYSTMTN